MKSINVFIISGLLMLLSFAAKGQEDPLWLRYPAISPDGQSILFNYKGDIFRISAGGGQAVPLTLSDSYEYSAVWSHDGSKIAFASDRYGNLDFYKLLNLTGGKYILLSLHRPSTGSKWEETAKPVSLGTENQLLYNRWVESRREEVNRLSDAHLFPVAYKMKGGGQTLGMPVPGTGTFVWWETQIDPTLYFGIPMGGWKPVGEPFCENNQMDPDIKVMNEPGKMAKGHDQQIEKAVEILLKK